MRKPRLSAVWLFLASLLCCGKSFSAQLARGPYTENPTQDSAIIRWQTDISTVAWLEYGPAPSCSQFLTISPSSKNHAITLFGLTPATTFCYRIYLPDDTAGVAASSKAAEGSFKTLFPPEQTAFEFLALSDSGSSLPGNQEIAAQLEKHPADFVIHSGDTVETGVKENMDAQYFQPYRNLLARAPFFLALGNHDYGRDRKKDAGKNFLRKNYTPYHRMPWSPGTPSYYYFDTANARFICLDTNATGGAKWAPAIDETSRQTAWLKSVLAKTQQRWKFVFLHHPVYSSGGHGNTEELVKTLAPILEKYKVDIVFQGHDHDYERTYPILEGKRVEKDGVIYLTLGGGGQQLYIQGSQNDWSAKFAASYNFAHVKVNDRALSLAVYDQNGDVIDTLELNK